jgi:hypothetical protein
VGLFLVFIGDVGTSRTMARPNQLRCYPRACTVLNSERGDQA